jgi:hypothetical protein
MKFFLLLRLLDPCISFRFDVDILFQNIFCQFIILKLYILHFFSVTLACRGSYSSNITYPSVDFAAGCCFRSTGTLMGNFLIKK